MTKPNRRQPILGIGIQAARRVRAEIGYVHPTEITIETLAFARGVRIRASAATGARAKLTRLRKRGIVAVADGLGPEERRWAIAHELGHFEAHADVSFETLCTSRDMVTAYEASGREPEANAFAAELLMPEALVAPLCDVRTVSWDAVRVVATTFSVSMTAAALRFVSLTPERVCLVCAKDGAILWTAATDDFGPRPHRDARVQPFTESYDWFTKGTIEPRPQTVDASAWIASASDEETLVEHLLAIPRRRVTMSLLWKRPA